MSQDQFFKYFQQNMNELGLPAPGELFATSALAYGTLHTVLEVIDKHGPKVTVRELLGAGTQFEKLKAIGAIGCAAYAGAIIGSLAVATGRSLSGGATIADAVFAMQESDMYRDWMRPFMNRWSGFFDKGVPARDHIKYQATL